VLTSSLMSRSVTLGHVHGERSLQRAGITGVFAGCGERGKEGP
jgi:hypothetical protein